jgi:hypothetical protein
MIPIFWKKYTCTVSGSVYKLVECEKCQQSYVYQMKREVEGQGNSLYFLDNQGASDRASQSAADDLQKQLAEDCDPVPCVACGWYQLNMVAKLRREYRRWWYWTGIGCFFLTVFLAIGGWTKFWQVHPDPVSGQWILILSVITAISGASLIFLRRFFAGKLEPNSNPEAARIALAKTQAMTMAEFENRLAEEPTDQPSRSRRRRWGR